MRAASVVRKCFSSQTKTKPQTIGPLRESSLCTSLEIPRPRLIYGYCRCREIESHFPSCKRPSTNRKLGTVFEAGVPKALFETRILVLTTFRNHYVVTGDGQRFLINSGLEETSTPISVVVNWTEDLKR